MKLYNTVLIFAYFSYRDPILQGAVLPYFRGLNTLEKKLKFILITFEQKQFKLKKTESIKIKDELKKENIYWHKTYYRSGKFKFFKKLIDILQSLLFSSYFIYKYKVNTIFSVGFPGAIMGHWLAILLKKKHIVHSFEPHAQYMIEAGVWKEKSWEAILLKKYQLIVAKKADVIMALTDAMVEHLNKLNIKAKTIRIPSCIDLDVFNYSSKKRLEIRSDLNIKNDEIIITYLGKFGGMYMDNEIFEFFNVCENYKGIHFRYFIFTNENKEKIYTQIQQNNLPRDKFLVKNLKREEVSHYLSAADFGLVAVRQQPSKQFCSPIKDGEYWACGLPIIIPKGISDDYIFAKQENIGIIMENLSEKSLNNVCDEIKEWTLLNKNEVVDRCRNFVKRDRSVEVFKKKYIDIFMNI